MLWAHASGGRGSLVPQAGQECGLHRDLLPAWLPALRNGGSRAKRAAAPLIVEDLNGITIFHLELIGSVGFLDPLSLEDEADGARWLSMAVAEGLHELLQLSRLLDLEHKLVVVISDLDI